MSSSSPAGRSIAAGAHRWSPAQLVQIPATSLVYHAHRALSRSGAASASRGSLASTPVTNGFSVAMSALEYPLETERLLLRPFTSGDFESLLAIQSRADVARHLYWEPRGEDEVRAALSAKMRESELHDDGDGLSLAVVLKESSELIGDCSLVLRSATHRQGEIGFVFHPGHGGRGYATEAARMMVRLAFTEFGMHRVIGRLEARNAASARVLERLGMRREAHFVENEFVKGEWQSELVYALLEHEWQAAIADRPADR